MKCTKFSLIVCSYNPNLEWLNEAIESAKGLFDEYILVDDGSTEPIEPPGGYTLIRKENGGLWTARNAGISQAKGDVICLLDDDDQFISEEVIKMQEFVKENYDKADIFSFKVQCFGQSKDMWGGGGQVESLNNSNQFTGVSWYKKSVWDDVGGYTYPLAEDWEFWIKAHKKNKIFLNYKGMFYKYRVRTESVSHSWSSNITDKILRDMKTLWKS